MPIYGFISGIGPTELVLVLVIVLVLFGAGRLPQVFEQFGRGIKQFRDAQREEPIDVTRASSSNPKELEDDRVAEAEEIREKQKTRNG